jgi:hypothetical protein
MGRMKTFFKYLLWLIGLYIFVTFASAIYIQNSYKNIEGTVEQREGLVIIVEDAKSTLVNGYIKGNVKNVTDTDIQSKYIKVDLISNKGNLILTKYLQIDDLKAGENKNFTLNFRANNIVKAKMSVTDEYTEEESGFIELIKIDSIENEPVEKVSIFIAALIIIKYFL